MKFEKTMTHKCIIFTISLLFGVTVFGQKTSFYKDRNGWKESPEKRAMFKRTEYLSGDTLMVQIVDLKNDVLVSEQKYLGDKAVGVWKDYDSNGELVARRDFSQLVYYDRSLKGMSDDGPDDGECAGCEPASFPGGDAEMYKFLGSNIKYPSESKDRGNSGTVYIELDISADGSVKAHSILRGVDSYIDLEVWRIVGIMPNWKPATKNGKPVESFWNLPVRFSMK